MGAKRRGPTSEDSPSPESPLARNPTRKIKQTNSDELLRNLDKLASRKDLQVDFVAALRPSQVTVTQSNIPDDKHPSWVRRFFTVLSFVSSAGFFFTMADSANSALNGFFAGAFFLVLLYLAGLELKRTTKTFWVRFCAKLFDSLKEFALIFTVVASLYAAATFYLRHTAVDSGTLGELRNLDNRILYVRVFLSTLKFSALQTIAIATLLLTLRWLERRWVGRQPALVDRTWRTFQSGTKWMSRIALIALFAASFTLLATRENGIGGEISAHIRDFEKSYTELRAATRKVLDSELKRRLLNQAWQHLPQSEREAIQGSIANYAESLRLNRGYTTLKRSFAAKNADIEKTLSSTTRIKEPDLASAVVVVANPQTEAGIPTSADDMAFETIKRLSKEAKDLSDQVEKDPPPEPLKSLADVIQTKLLDYGFDLLKEHAVFFEDLNKHFPGIRELFDAAWGAGGEAVLEKRKEARGRTIDRKLRSPDRSLSEIVGQEVDGLIHLAILPKPVPALVLQHSLQAKSRAAELRNARVLLVQEAEPFELDALMLSRSRTEEMQSQLDQLRAIGLDSRSSEIGRTGIRGQRPAPQDLAKLLELNKELSSVLREQSTGKIPDFFAIGDFPQLPRNQSTPQIKSELSKVHEDESEEPAPPSPLQNPHPQTPERAERVLPSHAKPLNVEIEMAKFSDKTLFPDVALTARLKSALRKEEALEDQIVAIVGRSKDSQVIVLKKILGENFSRYNQIASAKSAEMAVRELRDFPGLPHSPGERPWDRPSIPGEVRREYRPEIERPHPVEAPHPTSHPVP